jgi:hypothetical protein
MSAPPNRTTLRPPPHAPAAQACCGRQMMHAPPPAPHALAAVPGRHRPPEQHPFGHDDELQLAEHAGSLGAHVDGASAPTPPSSLTPTASEPRQASSATVEITEAIVVLCMGLSPLGSGGRSAPPRVDAGVVVRGGSSTAYAGNRLLKPQWPIRPIFAADKRVGQSRASRTAAHGRRVEGCTPWHVGQARQSPERVTRSFAMGGSLETCICHQATQLPFDWTSPKISTSRGRGPHRRRRRRARAPCTPTTYNRGPRSCRSRDSCAPFALRMCLAGRPLRHASTADFAKRASLDWR